MAKRGRASKLGATLSDAAADPAARKAATAAAAGGAVATAKLVRDRVVAGRRKRARRYRLAPDEPIGAGLRRIAVGQIDLAADRLRQSRAREVEDAIHASRKAFKRERAVVRLARDELGDHVYRHENATFRDAGRMLSDVRDAQVMVQTLDDLRSRFADELPEDAFTGLRETLATEADQAHERVKRDASAVRDVLGRLEEARTRVAGWPLRDDAGPQALAPGFERIYRRGRRALRAARKDDGDEALHELRKRGKDLWHAAQVLRPVAPDEMRQIARRAHRLADVVGEDHDLAVLLDGARQREHVLAPGELDVLDGLVTRRRVRLRRRALRRAGRLYRRKPRRMARTVANAPALRG